MTQLTCTGAGRSAAAAGYTFPLLTLFGEVERLAASGDYSVTCGTGAETLPVEFVNLAGNQTIAADTNWGNATADQRLLAVRVRGNLTIDATKTLTAAARKLGLLIFCDGDVTVNGTLSMTARGANHSATGSNLTAFDIMLYEVSAAADNIWPAAGGAGGAGAASTAIGTAGTAGTNGQTGGGGGGSCSVSGPAGDGADGTAYSGGPGGGSAQVQAGATSGTPRGGAGGAAAASSGSAGGGAGNPGGAGAGVGGTNGGSGTGGTLLIVTLGKLTCGATGIMSSNGSAGGGGQIGGGGSGGGSISLYHVGAYTNTGTVQANGGAGGTGSVRNGAPGGAGSIREVTL